MENTKMDVKINNMEYTIVSNESEEYVQRVALLVNKHISEVKDSSKGLSTAMLAVMASMNLADELLKSEKNVDTLRQEVAKYSEESRTLGAELETRKLEVETLKEDMHKLEIELAKRDTELENLRSMQQMRVQRQQQVSDASARTTNTQAQERRTSYSKNSNIIGRGAYSGENGK